jgi:hypothetical protein
MIDGILCEAIAVSLRARYPSVYVGLPQDDGRISMPCLILELRSDSIVGSPLERGHFTILVCSQADDATPSQHAEFTHDVATFMRTLTIASDRVRLYNYPVTVASDQQHAERHWQTPLTYTLGFGPVNL